MKIMSCNRFFLMLTIATISGHDDISMIAVYGEERKD